jgi:S-formylglutathione hydrolase FrmB
MIWLSQCFLSVPSRAAGCSDQRRLSAGGHIRSTAPRCPATSRPGLCTAIAVFLLLAVNVPAPAQFKNWISLKHVNNHLQGHVVDYTNNHCEDHQIFSPILQMPRDMYVYLPPGYDPNCAYPLILCLHMANVDEHYFIGSNFLTELENLMACGAFPPAIIACPDGTITGVNHIHSDHSLYVNGCNGRFEDHIMQEVVPFLMTHYAIRPEREAHALLGLSGGGYGAMNLAIKYRPFFATVAVMATPLNMRYSDCVGGSLADFNPATFVWKTTYDPDEVIATYYCGLWKTKASKFIGPVFGDGPGVVPQIIATNPADLLFTADLRPGQLAIYAHYPGQDNFNLDAHAQCFQWLAAQKGVEVTLACDPEGTHNHSYFRDNICPVLAWLGPHILPPGIPLAPALPPPIDSPQSATAPLPRAASPPIDSPLNATVPLPRVVSSPIDSPQSAGAPSPPAPSPPIDSPRSSTSAPASSQ